MTVSLETPEQSRDRIYKVLLDYDDLPLHYQCATRGHIVTWTTPHFRDDPPPNLPCQRCGIIVP